MRGVILKSWVDGYVDRELVCLKFWKNASFGGSEECGMELVRLLIITEQNWSRCTSRHRQLRAPAGFSG